ncbi:MAG: DUF2877 domain-containing protein [Anaerolineales bacterium]|jgi:hypothetical protein
MKITAIGRQASLYLKEEERGSIIGVTSSGVFIKTKADKILFLTMGPYRGPLTLNLEGNSEVFDRIKNGMGVVMQLGEISIPDAAFRIQSSQADMWPPPHPDRRLRTLTGRREVLHAFGREMHSLIKESDYPAIYLQLKALAQGDTRPAPESGSLFAAIHNLNHDIINGDFPGVSEAFKPLLGRGEGLTPAGDDLLLGWLLSLNRWHATLVPDIDLQPLNQAIVSAAYEKTTTISANLLECAVQGEADERLINVLDAIMCEGNAPVRVQHAEPLRKDKIITQLMRWGSSSGLYVFLGMVVATINP